MKKIEKLQKPLADNKNASKWKQFEIKNIVTSKWRHLEIKKCQEWYRNDSSRNEKNRKASKPLTDNINASKWKHLEIKKYC